MEFLRSWSNSSLSTVQLSQRIRSVLQGYLTKSSRITDIVSTIKSTENTLPVQNGFHSAYATPPDLETISLILAKGHARLDTYDGSPRLPLRTAVERQQVSVVTELWRLGSEPDACSSLAGHERPLWVAVQHNNWVSCEFFCALELTAP